MDISVSGKSIDVGSALQTHVITTLTNQISKYFERTVDVNVVFDKQGHDVCHCSITVLPGTKNGLVIKSYAQEHEVYAAFEKAAAKIAKQLKRYHSRLKDHHHLSTGEAASQLLQAREYVVQHEEEDMDVPDLKGENPVIIAEMDTEIPTLAVRDAVMRMDLADQSVFFFRNSKNSNFNIVYRRNDGNIGWIDPSLKSA